MSATPPVNNPSFAGEPTVITQLREVINADALRNPREAFLELNPHLSKEPDFANRYEARKEAAVLVPVMLRPEPTIVLTVRSPDMPSHAGQVSFPGGRVHADDHDEAHTALRETHEEVGIDPAHVSLIGDLGVHVGGLGYRVTPFVGLVDERATMTACPREVQEIFEVPLSYLIDINNHTTMEKRYKDVPYQMFHVPWEGYTIWGLTAGILRSLAERFRSAPQL